jgi:uncharacterized protein YbaP (TraB family)
MTPLRILAPLLLAAVALWSSPAPAQVTAVPAVSAPPATAPATPALPATNASRYFLWEVQSMTNRVYLYGTVHAGKREWFPLPGPIEAALSDAAVLAVEADVTDVAAMTKTAPATTYTPPDNLSRHVAPAEYERFRKQLAKYGLPEAQVSRVKPFMAVSLLVFSEWARLGFDPQFGIDAYLIMQARSQKKKVVELEGVEMQVKLMDSLTEAENRLVFEGTLKALESGLTGEQITGLIGAWQEGNPNLMLEIARKYNDQVPGAKEFEEKFIWSRHEDMANKIEGYLATKDRHFVAVGALHLAGPRGLVEMLRKRGYTVRQR